MKSLSVKAVLLKATTAAALAGALFLAAPKADAQHFAVGVQFGAPAYGYNDGPAYGPGPDLYEHRRWEREQAEAARREAWFRQEQWQRHEAWEHREAWRDRDAYRDRDRYDDRDYRRAAPYNGWR